MVLCVRSRRHWSQQEGNTRPVERLAEAIRSPQNPTFNPQMLPPEHQRSSAITLHTCSSGIYTASNTSTYDPDYPPAQSINNMTQFVHEYEYSE